MKLQRFLTAGLVVGVLLALIMSVTALQQQPAGGFSSQGLPGDISNFSGGVHIAVPTAVGTATPGLMVDCAGVDNCFEVRDGATPVWSVANGGAVTQSGSSTFSDNVTLNDALKVAATPATTATPQVLIQDVAAGVPFEIRNASATPMVAVDGSYNLDLNVGLDVDGTTNLDDLDVDGAADFGSTVAIATSLTVTGTTDVQGNIADSDSDLTIDDNAIVSGTLAVTGTTTILGDVTVSPVADGGNAGAKNEVTGLLRIKGVALGTMTNGSTETTSWQDANPAGEWAEVDAGTNLTIGEDTNYYRQASPSIKLTFTDVVENDGVDVTAPAQDDWSSNESFGFWIYSTVELASGDFDLTVDDSDGTDQVYTIGAVSANVWTWIEINIAACDANCDTVDGVFILATAQGAASHTAASIYIDDTYKWDASDEEALSTAILQDGALMVWTVKTDTAQANTQVMLVENTDYFVHYESGNDFLVTITDQSTYSGMAIVAY